jgi:protein-S-isoprenylcysteine O-methyltransferase Ste14
VPDRELFPKPYADFVQRLRVPFGFVLLAAFGWLSHPTRGSLIAGAPLAVLGLLLRGWAAGHLAKNEQLADSGPYAYIRNPLYAGSLIAVAGLAIAARSLVLAALLAAVFALVYLPAIQLEEQHLRRLFPGYAAYAASVPLLVPSIRSRKRTEHFRWSLYWRNEEYKAAAGFAAALAFLVWRVFE